MLEKRCLVPHPVQMHPKLSIAAQIAWAEPETLKLTFEVTGDLQLIELPEPAAPLRTDLLWRHTCFEAFFLSDSGAYLEYNLAPSTQWAAYQFDRYRSGMRPAAELPMPAVRVEKTGSDHLTLTGLIGIGGMPIVRIGLNAVIETCEGQLSYWALQHGPGAPDFHHPDCFALALPAPEDS